MLESKFKKEFKEKLKTRLPDLDLDFVDTKPNNRSFPDTVVLGPGVWAALEFKREEGADQQPNQDWHVARLNGKGYSSFVFPENEEEVLNGLEELFLSQ